jgi:hypothetical protein
VAAVAPSRNARPRRRRQRSKALAQWRGEASGNVVQVEADNVTREAKSEPARHSCSDVSTLRTADIGFPPCSRQLEDE